MIASKEKVEEAKSCYGRTIQDILAKEPVQGLYKVLGALEVLVSWKIYEEIPTTLGERLLFACKWMAIEVRNGGFHQYFFNSAGNFWQEVLQGLEAIGDKAGLEQFKRVLSIFPNSRPEKERFPRQDQLSKLEATDERAMWKHFTDTSHAYIEEPFPKWELVLDYIKSHQNEIDLTQV